IPYTSVKAVREVTTIQEGWLDTPCMVSSRTVGSSGLGWTTQGWRPISVNTQPAELARNGIGIDSRVNHLKALDPVVRAASPLPRVAHRAQTATMALNPARPIIRRKDQ